MAARNAWKWRIPTCKRSLPQACRRVYALSQLRWPQVLKDGCRKNNSNAHAQSPIRVRLGQRAAAIWAARARLHRSQQDASRCTTVLLAEGLLAMKLSVECQSLDQLQDALVKKLGQNSLETRRRYAQSILRWRRFSLNCGGAIH